MSDIQNVLSYHFKNSDWLENALNHRSFVNENRQGLNNEKLEFIGDAVLDLVLSKALYEAFPDDNEGDLSKKRASLVNEAVLSVIAQELKLAKFVRLGKGEALAGGDQRPRLLASTFESVVGAIFMDGGYDAADKVVLKVFGERLKDEKLLRNYEQDFKSRLQEIIQKKYKEAPAYITVEERGAPHDRVYKVEVRIQGQVLATAEGKSKKEAEQKAAQMALNTNEDGE